MLDFTQAPTWFTAGLSTTITLTLILLFVVWAASRAEHRH